MIYNNSFTKYSSAASRGKNTAELMILVLEKAKNHLKAAKLSVKESDLVEAGRHVFIVVQILEGLAKTITVKEEIPYSAEILKMYETLTFNVENLIASKAQSSEYDYFISYFDSLKKTWEENSPKIENFDSSESISINTSVTDSSKIFQKDPEHISAFDEEGRFEMVT